MRCCYMIDFKLIGEKIKNKRIEKKMTQEALAEKSELSVGYISNVETAKKKVSLNAIIKICNALEISLNTLLFGNQVVCPSNELTYEFNNLIQDCSRYEKQLIFEAAKSEKTALKKYEKLIANDIKENYK